MSFDCVFIKMPPAMKFTIISVYTLAQTRDLDLRQTSRDCAEHLELVLPKLKMILA